MIRISLSKLALDSQSVLTDLITKIRVVLTGSWACTLCALISLGFSLGPHLTVALVSLQATPPSSLCNDMEGRLRERSPDPKRHTGFYFQ